MAQWFGRLPLLQWPCCQSSWASAFKKLLEAFKLTVTSNRAFALFCWSVIGRRQYYQACHTKNMINYGNIMTESCGKRPHSHLADSSPKEIEIS